MAGIPVHFQAFSNVLASYDFVDIAAGTGIINFYAGNTVDLNLLSNHEFYAETVWTESTDYVGNAYQQGLDMDFDVLINRPLTLKGKIVVNVPITVYGDFPPTGYVTVKVRKWNGSTETEIASNDSSALTGSGGGNDYYMKAVDIDIPLTVFKIGEYLRLTIVGYIKTNNVAGTGRIGVAHDPMNRTTGWDATGTVPSKFVFQCPVRLNL